MADALVTCAVPPIGIHLNNLGFTPVYLKESNNDNYSCILCVGQRGKFDIKWTNFNTRWKVGNLDQVFLASLLPDTCCVVKFGC